MVSVKDLAERLNVTRQTIRNEMRRQGITPTENRDTHGRPCFMLGEEAAEQIAAVIRKRQEIREEERPSELELLRKERSTLAANADLLSEKFTEAEARIKELEAELKEIRLQLSTKEDLLAAKEDLMSAKDEQIRKTEEHSADLVRAMDNLSESLKAAQVLAAGYQQRIEQHNEKKWWQFWK